MQDKGFSQSENELFELKELVKSQDQKIQELNQSIAYSVLSDSISYYSFGESGEYKVLLTIQTEFNCIDTISKNLKVEDYSLWIPSAFTANNDGINDAFIAQGVGVKEFVMKIYSRWGGLVYETNDFKNGWNGVNDNNEIAQPAFIKIERIPTMQTNLELKKIYECMDKLLAI